MKTLFDLYRTQTALQQSLLDAATAASCTLTLVSVEASSAVSRTWLECQERLLTGMATALYADHLRRAAAPPRGATFIELYGRRGHDANPERN